MRNAALTDVLLQDIERLVQLFQGEVTALDVPGFQDDLADRPRSASAFLATLAASS